MDDAIFQARAAHCRQMAMATYDLAERTDEPELIAAYLDIATRWLRLADEEESRGRAQGAGFSR